MSEVFTANSASFKFLTYFLEDEKYSLYLFVRFALGVP